VLKYGALPLQFEKSSVEDVSPTLGSEQLRGGFIAGGIGLALVVLYLLFYYRGLGVVAIGSLLLSGLILYAATTVLGKTIGYTLTLAGIAGYIVAVGITADSFIVFFERLRDQVRESRGATLRSTVEKAWPLARRTIISADTVSFLAAVVLYFIAVGGVQGFAFTLGLSTVSDVFIVFLFTKPVVTLLARTKAFGSGRPWTGVGAALTGGPAAGLRRRRPGVATRSRTSEGRAG
jgi:preprotein translocase subunit SecD